MRFVKYFVLILSLFLIPKITNATCYAVSSTDTSCAYGSHCGCTLNNIFSEMRNNPEYCKDDLIRPILFWSGFETAGGSASGRRELKLNIPIKAPWNTVILGSSVDIVMDKDDLSCEGYSMDDLLSDRLFPPNFYYDDFDDLRKWEVDDDGQVTIDAIEFGREYNDNEFKAYVGEMSIINLEMDNKYGGDCSKMKKDYPRLWTDGQINGGMWNSIQFEINNFEGSCPTFIKNAHLYRVTISSNILTTLASNSTIDGLFIDLVGKDYDFSDLPLLRDLIFRGNFSIKHVEALGSYTTFRISKNAADHMNELYRYQYVEKGMSCRNKRPRYLKDIDGKCVLLFDPNKLERVGDGDPAWCKKYYKIGLLKDGDSSAKTYQIKYAGDFRKYSPINPKYRKQIDCDSANNMYILRDGAVLKELSKNDTDGGLIKQHIKCYLPFMYKPGVTLTGNKFKALCLAKRGPHPTDIGIFPKIGYVVDAIGSSLVSKYKSSPKNKIGKMQLVEFENQKKCLVGYCLKTPLKNSVMKMVDLEGNLSQIEFVYPDPDSDPESASPFTLYLDVLGNQKRVEINDESVKEGYIIHRGNIMTRVHSDFNGTISIVKNEKQILFNRAENLYDEYGRKVNYKVEQYICDPNEYYPILNVGYIDGRELIMLTLMCDDEGKDCRNMCDDKGNSCRIVPDDAEEKHITFLAKCKRDDDLVKMICPAKNDAGCETEKDFKTRYLTSSRRDNDYGVLYSDFFIKYKYVCPDNHYLQCNGADCSCHECPEGTELIGDYYCAPENKKSLMKSKAGVDENTNKITAMSAAMIEAKNDLKNHSEKLLEDAKNIDVEKLDYEDIDTEIRKSVSMSKVDKKALINDGPVQRARTGGCALGSEMKSSVLFIIPFLLGLVVFRFRNNN